MFHVYVEGVTGAAPDPVGAMRRLSEAIAARYGLPAADIFARLGRGRFRVKANVDHETANDYARDLEAIGARVCIEAVRTETVLPAPRASNPSLSAPRASNPSLQTSPPVQPPPPSLPRTTQPPTASPRASKSSLSPGRATFHPGTETEVLLIGDVEKQLGALGGDGLLTLGPLDERSEAMGSKASRGIDPRGGANSHWRGDALDVANGASRETGARGAIARAAGAAGPANGLASQGVDEDALTQRAPWTSRDGDRFAPPADEGAQLPVELAADEIERRAKKRTSHPPLAAEVATQRAAASPSVSPDLAMHGARLSASLLSELPVPRPRPSPSLPPAPLRGAPSPPAAVPPLYLDGTAPPGGRRSPVTLSPRLAPLPRATPSASASPEPPAPRAVRARWFTSPRVRFGAGVVLAIVLGFIPADLFASLRERSAFQEIDARVGSVQAAVDSPQAYEALDGFRAAQLATKKSARRTIVLTAMLLWAAAGGGFAYLWFRRVPWQRLDTAHDRRAEPAG